MVMRRKSESKENSLIRTDPIRIEYIYVIYRPRGPDREILARGHVEAVGREPFS